MIPNKGINKDISIIKYFVLPLYSMTYHSLRKEFVRGYLNRLGTAFYLELNNDGVSFEGHPIYDGYVNINNKHIYMFETPAQFVKDILLLLDGKYSEMSDLAKNNIMELSGLPYKFRDTKTNTMVSSAPLLALVKDPGYKTRVETLLNIKLPEESELFDQPTEDILIENLIGA